MAGGGRSQRPGFLDFLGVEAPSGNDLNVLPTKDIIDKWIVDNPGKAVPDPSRPKSLPLHRKEVLASFQYIKFLACVKAKVPALYERLRDAYRWLHDPTIYEEAFRNRPSQARDRSSRVRLPDADIASWIADGKIEEFRGEAKSFVHVFDVVELFKLRRRGICEPFINDFIPKAMLAGIGLPTRKDVRRFLFGKSTATAIDAAAFYDQFKLAPAVQAYFVFEHGGKQYTLTVLPMGFRPAADIAHLTAEAMLALSDQKNAMAYIDNFLFSGPEQKTDVTRFLDAAKKFGLIINEARDFQWRDDLEETVFDFLGERYDLERQTKESTEKTLSKVKRASELLSSYNGLISARTIAAICGILIYASPSHDIPLSAMFLAMRYLSFLGRVTTDWDAPAPPVDKSTREVLVAWAATILRNPKTPIFAPAPTTHDIEIQVDASSWGWGAVIIHSSGHIQYVQKQWPSNFRAHSSSVAEPMAAWLAVAFAAGLSTQRILLRSDHLNLVYAIKRGHSLTQSYNDFLHKTKLAFPNLLIDAEHIAGIDNTIPDKLSRGMSLGELGLTQRNQN